MRIARRLAVLIVLSLLAATARAADVTADVFVGPSGRDDWSGTLAEPNAKGTDGPLETPEAAREAVRKLRKAQPDRATPVTVMLRGGTYVLRGFPLTFQPVDGGTEASPTVWAAYPGETPVLSGGERPMRWTVSADGRWHTALAEAKEGTWHVAQLFVNGQRRFRPRLPKQSYWTIAARVAPAGDAAKPKGARRGDDRFRFPADTIRADWRNPQDVEVVTFHPWFTSMLRIASVDPAANLVTFTGGTRTDAGYGQLKGGVRFLVDNVAEALDAPGEWYVDRPTGELTYIPLPGETPDTAEVIVPRRETVLEIVPAVPATAGPSGRLWVEHLTFRGLTFAHANWFAPKDGYSEPQAAVTVPGMVTARGLRRAAFEGCTFTQGGTYGLELGAGCQHVRVEGCRFTDLGAGGVKLGATAAPKSPDDATTDILVRDNLIAHLGRTHPAGVGVWVGQADHCTVEHNDVYDLYYTAFSLGWTWGYGPSAAHDNTIAWNHAHHVGQGVLDDMGFVYTLGNSPGTTIHHNHFHDVERFNYGGWGIYYDEGSRGIVGENNLIYRTHDGGFHQHYGQDNVFANNVLLDSREVQFGPTRLDAPNKSGELREGLAFTFERNVVARWGAASVVRPEIRKNKLAAEHPEKFKIDDNVYWNGERPVRFADWSWDEWRKRGHDARSAIADPKLGDVSEGKVELPADSPALKLGFKPFDVSTAGRTKLEPADLDAARWPRAFPAPSKAGDNP